MYFSLQDYAPERKFMSKLRCMDAAVKLEASYDQLLESGRATLR